MASDTNGSVPNGASNGVPPNIILYTNHGCPYAHRAHIALAELGLPYKEVIIDLDTPREPWYLEVNPRGLVPTIEYSNGLIEKEIITESAIVAQFLADSRPSHLLPASLADPKAPLFRARVAFFTDTWNTKVQANLFTLLKAEGEEQEKITQDIAKAIEKEIEPLLKDAAPFFGGKSEMTMAEVIVAPFLLRFYAMSKAGLMPKSFLESVQKLSNFSKWADAIHQKESVTYVFNEKEIVSRTETRVAKMKQAAAAK